MIAAQLRQNGHRERDAIDPALIQGMRGDFHDGMAATGGDPVSYTHLDVYKRQAPWVVRRLAAKRR